LGGAVVDRLVHLTGSPALGTSNPAVAVTGFGGVARNVAENLARLGVPVALISRVGDDPAGAALRAELAALGVDITAVAVTPEAATAEYVAVLGPDGELVIGAALTDILDRMSPADLDAGWPGSGWAFLECNLPAPVLAHALDRAIAGGVSVAVDAVSAPKVTRLPEDLSGVGVLFCNRDEASAWLTAAGSGGGGLDDEALAARVHERGGCAVVLTRGAAGALVCDTGGLRPVAARPARLVDVTGAGDALVAGTLAGLLAGEALDGAVALGCAAAALAVESEQAVRPDLCLALVRQRMSGGPG
jgi:pseudouridine kinase